MHSGVPCMDLEASLDHILLIFNKMFMYMEQRYTVVYLTITSPPVTDHCVFP